MSRQSQYLSKDIQSALSSAEKSDCYIEGHSFTPHCDFECREECFRYSRGDLVRNVNLALHDLNEAERVRPETSLPSKRIKHILHCLLVQPWHVVLWLRDKSQQDARVTAAHIVVRLPGREAGTSALSRRSVRWRVT